MKKFILGLTALVLFGCSNEKAQDVQVKTPDTVVIQNTVTTTVNHTDKPAQPPEPKKDILDKANESLDKANTAATKSGQVIDKAAALKKKTDEIINK
ncbi:MAG: hypothetical protein WCH46_04175 [bacterium]